MCLNKDDSSMGFRHFHSFNLALLGKHCWHLLTCQNSLLYRTYRAKYFPSENFFSSVVGNNPSFAWRGICQAKDVIKNGFHLKVGSGLTINL